MVLFGDEILLKEKLDLIKNKRLGVVTNQSAVLPNQVHLVDFLINLGFDIKALFSPEHGIRGNISAGEKVQSSIDSATGIPVYSLYGKNKKPTKQMLSNIDVMIFDIQDVGARFYTYLATLYYVLQSASENNIPVIVLDRPNPINGNYLAGPVLDTAFKSMIGIAPIPVAYGMTIGEFAKYLVGDNIINVQVKPSLEIVKMVGWKRSYDWYNLDHDWIQTSPNIPKPETALIYPGTCFIEGTNFSEGRGTDNPFLTIGAPFIDSKELADFLNSMKIPGVSIKGTSFTPVEIEGKALKPKYEGINCFGIKLGITNKRKFKPVEFGITLLYSLLYMYPENFKFLNNHFDLLAGSNKLRKDLLTGKSPTEIINGWQEEINNFNSIRKKYLLY